MRLNNGWAVAIAALATVATAACDATNREADLDAAGTGTPGIEYGVERTDSSITTRIQAEYFDSDVVRGQQIDVDTNDGVVTLTGRVENLQVKEEAVRLAQTVEGAARVDDRLTVAAEDSMPRSAATREGDGSPAWTTTKIQAQYFVNPQIKPWNIDVTTADNGVVTLSGSVESQDDRDVALRIARSTEGVASVTDQLRIESETAVTSGATAEPTGDRAERQTEDAARTAENTIERTAGAVADSWITARIQSGYFLDNDIKGRNIDVDTENGIVTVRGSVASDSERLQAIALARNTDGVAEVRDELRVERSMDEGRGGGANGDAGRTAGTAGRVVDDAWITTKLQSKFFIDDRIRPFKVDIETESGVVTLTGSVASDEARQSAEQLARDTDGVTQVVNNLMVDATTEERDREQLRAEPDPAGAGAGSSVR